MKRNLVYFTVNYFYKEYNYGIIIPYKAGGGYYATDYTN